MNTKKTNAKGSYFVLWYFVRKTVLSVHWDFINLVWHGFLKKLLQCDPFVQHKTFSILKLVFYLRIEALPRIITNFFLLWAEQFTPRGHCNILQSYSNVQWRTELSLLYGRNWNIGHAFDRSQNNWQPTKKSFQSCKLYCSCKMKPVDWRFTSVFPFLSTPTHFVWINYKKNTAWWWWSDLFIAIGSLT